MDYSRIYIELMERSNERVLEGYYEKHHIVPKCMGGDDKPRNIALLTPEEHYLAHQLLVKIYPDNRGLVYAAHMMCIDRRGGRFNNKSFGWLKRKFSIEMSNLHKGKSLSDETKLKLVDYYKNNGHPRLGIKHSDETKEKISKSKIGYKHTDDYKKAVSLRVEGNKHPRCKPVTQLTVDDIFINEWDFIKEASKHLHIDNSSIVKCCKGKVATAGGFKWKYSDDTTT